MPKEPKGLALSPDVWGALQTLAAKRKASVSDTADGLLRSVLEETPLVQLAAIRKAAWEKACSAHDGEISALRALLATAEGRHEDFQGALAQTERAIADLRNQLLTEPDFQALPGLRQRLAALQDEASVLESLLSETSAQVEDIQRRLAEAEKRKLHTYAVEFEQLAWPLLEHALQYAARALEDLFGFADEVVGTSRDLGGARSLKLRRYLELQLWGLLAQTQDPTTVAYARAQVFTDGPMRTGWLRTVIENDFPGKLPQPPAKENAEEHVMGSMPD